MAAGDHLKNIARAAAPVAAPVAAAVIVIPAKIRRRFVNVDNYFYFNKSSKKQLSDDFLLPAILTYHFISSQILTSSAGSAHETSVYRYYKIKRSSELPVIVNENMIKRFLRAVVNFDNRAADSHFPQRTV